MPDDDFAFEIPELNRIGSLMRDLYPEPGAKPARRSAPRKAANGRPVKAAAATLAQFRDAINWRNADGFRSPFAGPTPANPARTLGGLTVAAFAAGANWVNAADGSRLTPAPTAVAAGGPPETVETFMDAFGWD